MVKVFVMARKTVSRKQLRAESEAAERAEATGGASSSTKKKTKAAGETTTRSRAKATTDIRMKLYWGVFNQSLKRVALYEFNQRKQAEQKAEDLTKSGKTPHFVQRVKEAVEPS